MACSACYTLFLDNAAPGLRTFVHSTLEEMALLPLDAIQGELDQWGDFLNEVDSQVDDFFNDLNNRLDLTNDLEDELTAQGILPGTCPQVDLLMTQIQQNIGLITSFKNPLDKQLAHAQLAVGQLTGYVASINSLVSQANGLIC